MPSVSVSELKAHLAKYLRTARRGGEVRVLERGVPIARLVGVSRAAAGTDRVERLAKIGILRPGTSNLGWLLEETKVRAPAADLSGALDDDRSDRV